MTSVSTLKATRFVVVRSFVPNPLCEESGKSGTPPLLDLGLRMVPEEKLRRPLVDRDHDVQLGVVEVAEPFEAGLFRLALLGRSRGVSFPGVALDPTSEDGPRHLVYADQILDVANDPACRGLGVRLIRDDRHHD